MNTSIFWDKTPYCGLKFKQESSMKHPYLLHEEICSFDMSVDFKRNIRRYIPEHRLIQNWKYLKSRTGIICIQKWMENYSSVFHPKRIKLNQHSAIRSVYLRVSTSEVFTGFGYIWYWRFMLKFIWISNWSFWLNESPILRLNRNVIVL